MKTLGKDQILRENAYREKQAVKGGYRRYRDKV